MWRNWKKFLARGLFKRLIKQSKQKTVYTACTKAGGFGEWRRGIVFRIDFQSRIDKTLVQVPHNFNTFTFKISVTHEKLKGK